MYSQRRGTAILLGLVLILIMMTSITCVGDPFFKLILENQTRHELTIYVNDYKLGNVSPGEQVTDRNPITITKFHIEAKNTQGEIIFSETLTREQMQRIESLVWKVVITDNRTQ